MGYAYIIRKTNGKIFRVSHAADIEELVRVFKAYGDIHKEALSSYIKHDDAADVSETIACYLRNAGALRAGAPPGFALIGRGNCHYEAARELLKVL